MRDSKNHSNNRKRTIRRQNRLRLSTESLETRLLLTGNTPPECVGTGAHSQVAVSSANLLHRYTFDTGAVEDSAGTIDGRLVNGATIQNGQLVVDGVNDHAELDGFAFPFGTDYSIGFEAQLSPTANFLAHVISQGTNRQPGFYVGFKGREPNRAIRLGDEFQNTGVPFPTDGLMHEYLLTSDATIGTKFFIDGQKVFESLGNPLEIFDQSNRGSRNKPTRFGVQFNGREAFPGVIDNVTIFDGAVSEEDASGVFVPVLPPAPTVTVTQTDGGTDVSEGGTTDSYTVALGDIPNCNVPIVVYPMSGQLDLGNGPGNGITLTFTPGNALIPQVVNVAAVDDTVAEGPHSDLIGHLVTGYDPNYAGLAISNLPVNIVDNDNTATPAIVIGDSGVGAAEGGATDTYTVSLASVPTGSVDVTITPDGQLDLGGGAGTAVTLNFTPATALTPQTVTVTAFDDVSIEGTHLGAITHSAASGDANYNGLAGSGVSVVITDNDVAPDPFTPTNISVSGSSWTGTPYQLTNNLSHVGASGYHGRTLSWLNLDTVTVTYTGTDPASSDLNLSDASLTPTFVGAAGGVATWTVADAVNPLAGIIAGVTNQIGPKGDLTVTAGGSLAVTVDVVPGDIDANFTTDIGDILAWVSKLNLATPTTSAPDFSDIDGSGLTDVSDVQAIILANGAASTPAAAALDSPFSNSQEESQVRSLGFEVDSFVTTDDAMTNRRRTQRVARRGSYQSRDAQDRTAIVDDAFASLGEDRIA